MKERGILFSAPMMRALLEGSKTQTRRAVKPRPDIVAEAGAVVGVHTPEDARNGRLGKALFCPYGAPGDRLWVREAYRFGDGFDAMPPRDVRPSASVWYEAEKGSGAQTRPAWLGKLRPGMFMPRWASRITLEVTGVRVERLQDISAADAIAEGIEPRGIYWRSYMDANSGVSYSRPENSYASLWDSINGDDAWDENPWVWCVSFKRLESAEHKGGA